MTIARWAVMTTSFLVLCASVGQAQRPGATHDDDILNALVWGIHNPIDATAYSGQLRREVDDEKLPNEAARSRQAYDERVADAHAAKGLLVRTAADRLRLRGRCF